MSNGNCSFCGKSHTDVFRLITSDGCKICNECIGRCANIVASELQRVASDIIALPPPLPPTEPSGSAA